MKNKIKLPTLDEFEANMKNNPLHKLRSTQFKKGMIAGYIETIDMINGIFYDPNFIDININGQFHPCNCTDYNGKQCYNCLNGFHEGCIAKCNKKNAKHLGVILVLNKKSK